MESGKKFGSHAFAINNDSSNGQHTSLLLIARHNGMQPDGQMLIPTVSRSEQRMTVLVMQEGECPTPQNDTQTPHQSAWDQRLGVDGFAMSIDVEGCVLIGTVIC